MHLIETITCTLRAFLMRLLLLIALIAQVVFPVVAEDLKIPVLVGQTGASASFGKNETDGYTLAAEEWNGRGGVRGKRVVLDIQDTETSSKQILSAFNLYAMRGARVVLGPTWLDGFAAVIPVARKRGVLLVTPSAAIEALSDDDRTWPVSFQCNITAEIKTLSAFLRSKNRGKIALFYQHEPFSEMIRRALLEQNPPIIVDIGVQAGEAEFRPHLLRLRESGVDSIVVFVFDQRSLLNLLQQIRVVLPDIPLFTNHDGEGWLKDSVFQSQLPRLTHSRFVIAEESFEQKFKSRFGYAPFLTASNAYDALNSVLSALESGAESAIEIREYITKNELNSATFGVFRFNQDGSIPSKVEVVEYAEKG